MPSKTALFHFVKKHGDDSIDRVIEMLSNPASRQCDVARAFGEHDSMISKFLSTNFIFIPVLHPDLREMYEELRQYKDERHNAIVENEKKVLKFVAGVKR